MEPGFKGVRSRIVAMGSGLAVFGEIRDGNCLVLRQKFRLESKPSGHFWEIQSENFGLVSEVCLFYRLERIDRKLPFRLIFFLGSSLPLKKSGGKFDRLAMERNESGKRCNIQFSRFYVQNHIFLTIMHLVYPNEFFR